MWFDLKYEYGVMLPFNNVNCGEVDWLLALEKRILRVDWKPSLFWMCGPSGCYKAIPLWLYGGIRIDGIELIDYWLSQDILLDIVSYLCWSVRSLYWTHLLGLFQCCGCMCHCVQLLSHHNNYLIGTMNILFFSYLISHVGLLFILPLKRQ